MKGRFDGRWQRNKYIYDNFIRPLKVRGILDIGCSANYMKRFHDGLVVGVDISGNPDIHINLEIPYALNFSERSFDCVIALDVLEHLSNMHDIIKDMIRIADRYIVFTFPNELRWLHLAQKFIAPNDREQGFFPRNEHKWFVSYSQCKDFSYHLAKEYNLKLLNFDGVFLLFPGADGCLNHFQRV